MIMKVLILDTTHGGEILGERYMGRGDEVTCVDVYKVTPSEVLDRIRSKGMKVPAEVPEENFDLVVMPCHCPDVFLEKCSYGKRIFFSEAVNTFMPDGLFRIEITGVKGKTSTCYVLANILEKAGKKVFVHSSRGEGPWTDGDLRISEKKSIAPPMLLEIPEKGYDVCICEVSLGGSGKADIAGITNLASDYGIARNTRKASEAKAAVLTEGINVVRKEESEFWSSGRPGKFVGCGNRITVEGTPEFGKPLEIKLNYDGTSVLELSGNYLALQYIEAMDMASEICHEMKIDRSAVEDGLKSFKGVPGRGEIYEENGVRRLKERNPGISALSVGRTLGILDSMGALENSVMIVDPVSRKVCDKMDSEAIRKVAESYGVEIIFTDGDGNRPEIPEGKSMIIDFVKEGFQ